MEMEKTIDCPKHGPYTARYHEGIGRFVPASWSKCPECLREDHEAHQAAKRAREEEASRRYAEEERKRRIELYWKESNIPKRYIDAEWDSYERISGDMSGAYEKIRSYSDAMPENAAKGRSLLLNGLPGTGKTMLACLVAKDAIKNHALSAGYLTAKDIFLKIRASYRRDALTSEEDIIAKLGAITLLVIDEIGVQKGSESELETFQHLIDRRYQNMNPTILISNLPIDQWPQFLGQRGLDRMRENGGQAIAFTWGSHRK